MTPCTSETDLSPEALARFDAIIDVRSPAEYAADHVPGATNLPVLDDSERAEIGRIYKQVSPFEARRLGAAKVARNIARHLDGALAGHDRDFRPLVYCWRGGMRSRSMALVMGEVGWRAGVLQGGYRTWRKAVVDGLSDASDIFPAILIDGQTGTAKTEILHRLAARGAQTLDLEGLAGHRGSIFGDLPDRDQPGQKRFETLLWDRLRRMDLSRPVFIEAESSRLGRRVLPPRIWASMKQAPRIAISAPSAARARYLLAAYPDIVADPARLNAALDGLAPFHPKADIALWRDWAASGAWQPLAEALIAAHYDPAYDRARARREPAPSQTLETESLDDAALDRLADRVLEMAGVGS